MIPPAHENLDKDPRMFFMGVNTTVKLFGKRPENY